MPETPPSKAELLAKKGKASAGRDRLNALLKKEKAKAKPDPEYLVRITRERDSFQMGYETAIAQLKRLYRS
jgi:hypothetical protein